MPEAGLHSILFNELHQAKATLRGGPMPIA